MTEFFKGIPGWIGRMPSRLWAVGRQSVASWDNFMAAIMVALVAIFLVSMVTLLVSNLLPWNSPGETLAQESSLDGVSIKDVPILDEGNNLPDRTRISVQPLYDEVPVNPEETAALTLAIDDFIPAEGRVVVTIAVNLPCTALTKIVNLESGAPVVSGVNPDTNLAELVPGAETGGLTLDVFDTTTGSVRTFRIPLQTLLRCTADSLIVPTFGAFTLDTEFNLIDSARSFPDDWYRGQLGFTLRLEPGFGYQVGEGEPISGIPTIGYIAPSTNLSDVRLKTTEDIYPEAEAVGFELLIYRDATSRWFAYGMAMIPLFLALLFGNLLSVRRRLFSDPVNNLVLIVAATIIAVLLLHNVIVPAEISETTRIDLILGVGLAAILSVAVWFYTWWIWDSRAGSKSRD